MILTEVLPFFIKARLDLAEPERQLLPVGIERVDMIMSPQECSQGMRLDAALVARGVAPSREQAKKRIQAGEIYINDRVAGKAAVTVYPDDILRCEGGNPRFVGRGGYKLEKAINIGHYDLKGVRAMDVGASTGGFTDCMLQQGAGTVYSIDVGHGQLHPKLIVDSRVHNLEGMDIRCTDSLRKIIDPSSIAFCSIDVSFISVKKIFSYILPFLEQDASVVCLIKPQFEAGRQAIGKNGVVKDPKAHKAVIDDLCLFFHSEGCTAFQLDYSPVTGGEGNIEYLALLKYNNSDSLPMIDTAAVVSEAHKALKG